MRTGDPIRRRIVERPGAHERPLDDLPGAHDGTGDRKSADQQLPPNLHPPILTGTAAVILWPVGTTGAVNPACARSSERAPPWTSATGPGRQGASPARRAPPSN